MDHEGATTVYPPVATGTRGKTGDYEAKLTLPLGAAPGTGTLRTRSDQTGVKLSHTVTVE